mgnify:CR=1 FL=1
MTSKRRRFRNRGKAKALRRELVRYIIESFENTRSLYCQPSYFILRQPLQSISFRITLKDKTPDANDH